MTSYYNEIDPHAAQWLRNLIAAGVIAPGDVDERSIEDVRPDDLRGYTQCHFFAGIGGWAYALDLAGWPRDRPVWTGSCPCQPFSAAGKGAGFADERHLWPAWQHLIAQCLPPVVFGEQVASKDAEPWIDLVQADLEGLGYAFGCVPFPAAGVGAPQLRDRNYWLANADSARLEGWEFPAERANQFLTGARGVVGGLADADRERIRSQGRGAAGSAARGVQGEGGQRQRVWLDARASGAGMAAGQPGPVNGHWRNADWLGCTDGMWRPVEPGTFPLGDGIPARVGRLRAYGNAIVPQQAAEFIRASVGGQVARALEAA